MRGRTRTIYTETHKALMWERWQKAFGRIAVSKCSLNTIVGRAKPRKINSR
jgi:hypothetical protein